MSTLLSVRLARLNPLFWRARWQVCTRSGWAVENDGPAAKKGIGARSGGGATLHSAAGSQDDS